MVISMIPNTIKLSTRISPRKIKAAWASMVKAITMAPSTTKGDRSSSRSPKFTPFCSWLISDVIRVTMVELPILSIWL